MEFSLPTQFIDLPSKGLIYPEANPLSAGEIEMRVMGAKQEDILTDENYLDQGIAVEKFIQSMIVSKIDYNDLILGDKDAIMIASRILGYGKDYHINYKLPGEKKATPITIDLTTIKEKYIDETAFTKGVNEFKFSCPMCKVELTFKLLNHKDEQVCNEEIEGLLKAGLKESKRVTTRLKHTITSVNGQRDTKTIRDFVDNGFPAPDILAFREYITKVAPGVELKFSYTKPNGEVLEDLTIPLEVQFFWP